MAERESEGRKGFSAAGRYGQAEQPAWMDGSVDAVPQDGAPFLVDRPATVPECF